jgi:myo-inositol-hexaphosphate 3-phosphohydrolase
MEATCYDFQINGLKIQEKVISTRNDKKTLYLFNIVKNNVNKNITNKSHCQYSAGDNDFYWINCNNCIIWL